ncbi:MAG TPA: biotin carboxylase N-terminal domain-containing protein [Vicinamibacterales bacterium]|nr:biotin carboxylase N-terminal domain-containing protein [Vicinamibacterales bacterium]
MKVLIANRGEIAVRVIRACREMGLPSVAVYSDCDRASLHVRYADEAYPLGGNAPSESYLRIDALIEIARRSGADAVHPGYGFLAENEAFARACAAAGLVFVGPPAEAIERMGSKTSARQAAIEAGVPVVPGTTGPLPPNATEAEISSVAGQVGYPIFVKAVAGGGGKGMRLVTEPAELPSAVRAARSEARSSFGDPAIYIERQLQRPRHIEIQLLADASGTVVPFTERECSIQRRHQKVLEESPSVAVTPAKRRELADAAVAVARAVGYVNAGTIEFLLDEDGRFYFLEMNTRLQVEHPITELVSGVDLVRWQLRIARGERLDLSPGLTLSPRGHAVECRIYAEDPDNNFLPSAGLVLGRRVPGGPGIRRDDGGVTPGLEVPIYYDPLIAKLTAWGGSRDEAVERLGRALGEYEVRGIKTSIPFFRWLFQNDDFRAGRFDTTFLDRELAARNGVPFVTIAAGAEHIALLAAAIHAFERAAGNAGAAPRGRAASAWTLRARSDGLRNG